MSLGRGEHDFDIGPTHPMLPDVFSALDWAYDSAPTQAYRISRALAGVRGLLGRYPEFDRQYTWLAERDGSDDPVAWAAAIAGIGGTALALGRDDYLQVMTRAEPLLDPDDAMSRCYLRQFPRRSPASTVTPPSWPPSSPRPRRAETITRCGSSRAWSPARTDAQGALDEADAAVAAIERVLKRRQLNLRLDTGLAAVGVAIYTATQRGDIATARSLAAAGGQPDATQVFTTSSCLGLLAYATGDADLMHRAVSWQAAAEAGMLAGLDPAAVELSPLAAVSLNVHCWAALLERRHEDASVPAAPQPSPTMPSRPR